MAEQHSQRVPRHANPTRADRVACAPYNFVPLPERVVGVRKAVPPHDRYVTFGTGETAHTNTGYFDVVLTARTPIYVRAGLTRKQFATQERQERPVRKEGERQQSDRGDEKEAVPFRDRVKNRPEFFYISDPTQPVIPGSSLRGMLRSIVEIASYGKVAYVTNKKLFFRSVDNTSLGVSYRERMVGKERFGNKVEGGFLQRAGGPDIVGTITPCEVLRIPQALVARAANGTLPRLANQTPDWRQQYHEVWVKRPIKGVVVTDARPWRGVDEAPPGDDWVTGVLVITGASPGKRKEFVFLCPDERLDRPEHASITIKKDAEDPATPDLIVQFEDDDQITQWQQRAFRRNDPKEGCRERDGFLRNDYPAKGEPVFFLREGDERELSFFGRAQMFRLPYEHTPRALVSEALRDRGRDEKARADYAECTDYAEALFGYVRDKRNVVERAGHEVKQGDIALAYAGRVTVGDATLVAGQGNVLASEAIVPPILGTPKPTAFQHYLVQQQSVRDRLSHFDSDGATIRGHKRYWHQGPRAIEEVALSADELGKVKVDSTQHTQFRPVKAGTRFQFRVHFENLSGAELGALCWALQPLGPESVEYAHSLGMGKSLGMGAVTLAATLHLTDRERRYEALFADDGGWEAGEEQEPSDLGDRATLVARTRDFERHVLDELGFSLEQATHLYELERIGMLLRMMEWPGIVPREPTFEDPTNRPGNVRPMRLNLPHVSDPRERNEFRSRPVLPDPSAFGRPLSGTLVPAADRAAVTVERRRAEDERARAGDGRAGMDDTVARDVAPRSERVPSRRIEPPAPPPPKRGTIVEAEVLQVNRNQGKIQVRLRLEGQEPQSIRNIALVFLDSARLAPGSTIRCRIEDVDPRSGKVTRVSWKR